MELAIRQNAKGDAATISLVVRRAGGARTQLQALCRVPRYSSQTGWTGTPGRLFAVTSVVRHDGRPIWICVAGPIGPDSQPPYAVQHVQVPYYDPWTYECAAYGVDQPDDHSLRTSVYCRYCRYRARRDQSRAGGSCWPLARLVQWCWRVADGRRSRATAHACHPAVGGEHMRPLRPGVPEELRIAR